MWREKYSGVLKTINPYLHKLEMLLIDYRSLLLSTDEPDGVICYYNIAGKYSGFTVSAE